MLDLIKSDRSLLSGSARLIVNECEKRGWKVIGISSGSSRMMIDRGDGKYLHILGSIPPSLGYIAGATVNDKYLTSVLLSQNGIRQLACLKLTSDTTDQEIETFIHEHSKVVIKPLDGAHGNGITVGISDLLSAKLAIARAAQSSNTARVIIQEMVKADEMFDVRVLCIDKKFIAAIHRIPAHVRGDGSHTIGELIQIENSTFRGEAYKKKFAYIDVERATRYLGSDITKVPRANELVRVIDVANYGAGGELIDVTDDIPEWMKIESETVCSVLDLPVAGVDYLISSESISEVSRSSAVIIEVNKGPSLAIHDEPTVGVSRHATKAYADLLQRL